MSIKSIRNQIAVFGNFNFPADSDTTVALLKAFGSDGFMPQTVQTVDPFSGLTVQRLTLVSSDFGGSEVSAIVFAPDRIDITTALPVGSDIEPYITAAAKYLARVADRAPNYWRLGLVRDFSVGKFGDGQDVGLLGRLLPIAPNDSFEWSSRWVSVKEVGGEKYNYQIEATKQVGMGIVAGNRLESIEGVKMMHDVSTSPEVTAKRFNAGNVEAELLKMARIIGDDPIAFVGGTNHG
jgi:hypothetical protein